MNRIQRSGRHMANWVWLLCALSAEPVAQAANESPMGVVEESAASAERVGVHYKVLHSFNHTDGANPLSPPILGSDGKIHGVTMFGGPEGAGTAFRMTLAGQLTVLHDFDEYTVSHPWSLMQNRNGDYYGTSWESNFHQPGAVFRMKPNGQVTRMLQLSTCGPPGSLLQLDSGEMIGAGGVGCIFHMTPWLRIKVLHEFTADEGVALNALMQGPSGAIYGTARSGGPHDQGTAFKMTLDGALNVLHVFGGDPTEGTHPSSGLVLGTDGNWYGTTSGGGAYGLGTLYRLGPAGEATVLHSFAGGPHDGSHPGELLLGRDGHLYGTSYNGGRHDCGIAYSATLDGAITLLHAFGPILLDGANPVGLIEVGDGEFFGTTFAGGVGDGYGAVFRLRTQAKVTAHAQTHQAVSAARIVSP